MTATPTFKNQRFGAFYYFFLTLMLMPFAAQSQNNTTELEQRMNTLYAQARDLRADLPVRDYRGNYLNLTFGTSPLGHIKTWHTENVCDCEGNVVDTKNVTSNKAPVSFGIGWETRLNALMSMRFMGSYAHLTHSRGSRVIAENGAFSTMKQDYNLTIRGVQSAALLHFNHFYSGVGISYTSSKASGLQTTTKKDDAAATQYYQLKADILSTKQTNFAGNVFVGYKMMATSKVLVSLEMGISRKFYANVQLNFPLSSKTTTSLANWQQAHRLYEKVRREAVSIDRHLHPSKFQTDDCNNNVGSNSNSCPR